MPSSAWPCARAQSSSPIAVPRRCGRVPTCTPTRVRGRWRRFGDTNASPITPNRSTSCITVEVSSAEQAHPVLSGPCAKGLEAQRRRRTGKAQELRVNEAEEEQLLPRPDRMSLAQQGFAADCQKPTLRSGFRQRLKPSVRCCACSCEGRRVHWLSFSGSH